uniref:KHA domain-containing protein n=1 Tax=Spermophilus dauricus TaxID=99837 RepID=A0A8C9P6G7_SPEDA
LTLYTLFFVQINLVCLQVVAVYGTLSDLLSVASSKLGIKATSVYNGKGGLIDDIALIRSSDRF